MIDLDGVTFTYDGADAPVLLGVDLHVEEGELVVVTGPTGSGKSTLLGLLDGLVPHFSGGHLRGTVTVDGVRTDRARPRDLASVVGWVGQDPLAGFVTDTVEEELAYGMEQLGVDPQTMRRRVEETLDLLGIADLRRRSLRSLSGGQQQRVAIGSVLTMHPPVLVLDEPTSALDPTAAEDVLATLTRLVHDLGATVVVAEHRLERVVPFADVVVRVERDGSVVAGEPAALLADSPTAPPIVGLGRLAGWDPLPLTVREARRAGRTLRKELADLPAPVFEAERSDDREPGLDHSLRSRLDRRGSERSEARSVFEAERSDDREPLLTARGIGVRYGPLAAVRDVDLRLDAGVVTALMGRNGSGKSSLLWAVQGAGPRQQGSVEVAGEDPAALSRRAARRRVGLVPQTASDLLYLETVERECAAADAEADASPGTCAALLERFAGAIPTDANPRDLSEGQKLALVLAVQLTAAPRVVLLDEPTRGLDYAAKDALAATLRGLAADGHTVAVATHDVEFVAEVADRAVVMADGEVIADGEVRDVLAGSPAFAPQVAKVLGDRWLTVDDVRAALEGRAP
ncbi:energy-coupling factor transport system ATP-binding protein [Mumia flava]|uniref:Energy-coupling factor transport system ATP-binding protein n=1 Tax=Mumia flava TaxID=1348852 RepID=A0A0B2BUV0_9ACTN|nr:ABC transporter ATP-binding protein [Mumia flava]PJJ58068.1 energy-coupling factor transport system ATP-binding protein [Mumia flava]